jgi:hypothetical protein
MYIQQEILFQISEQAPRALSTFIFLKNRQDDDHQVFIDKNEVTTSLSLSWTRFVNDVKALARLGLLEWVISNQTLSVTLAEDYETSSESVDL